MISLLNQQEKKAMALRCMCSSDLVSLLRRAAGLDLLDLNESTIIDTVQHPETGKLIAVERDLIYPVAGYPPSGSRRRKAGMSSSYRAVYSDKAAHVDSALTGPLHSTDSKSFKSDVPGKSTRPRSLYGKAKNYFKRLMGG